MPNLTKVSYCPATFTKRRPSRLLHPTELVGHRGRTSIWTETPLPPCPRRAIRRRATRYLLRPANTRPTRPTTPTANKLPRSRRRPRVARLGRPPRPSTILTATALPGYRRQEMFPARRQLTLSKSQYQTRLAPTSCKLPRAAALDRAPRRQPPTSVPIPPTLKVTLAVK